MVVIIAGILFLITLIIYASAVIASKADDTSERYWDKYTNNGGQ